MKPGAPPTLPADIPLYGLYGEGGALAGHLHLERIADRAHLHDWQIAPHRHHDLHQIVLVEGGEAFVTADGTQQQVTPPVVVSVAPFVVHGFRFRAGTQGLVLTLTAAGIPEVFARAPAPLPGWGAAPAPLALTRAFHQLWAEWTGRATGRDLALRGLALQVAALTARALDAERGAQAPRAGAAHLARLEALVSAHLTEGWRLRDYAAALGVTPAHLNRVLRAATGLSAAAWLEARLFREARRLLAYTTLSVAEVGYKLGYEDPAYFSRAFRRHAGLSPKAWRAEAGATDLPESAWRPG